MMAVLAAILPVVSSSSRLTLELYQAAAESTLASKDFIEVASTVNSFASILKQVGTFIKENDRLPSHEAIETLEDVIDQSQGALSEIRTITSSHSDSIASRRDGARYTPDEQWSPETAGRARLKYLAAHLEVLRLTLSVLLQSLYAVQSIMWSRLRPTISPQQVASAVNNEKLQLEGLIMEQQLSTLAASRIYEQKSQPDSRLLMESDSSQSLVAKQGGNSPTPADLYRHQDRHVSSLDASSSNESEWLKAVCKISSARSTYVLDNWTNLLQFNDRLREAEQELLKQKQETQQPTVESDSEDDLDRPSALAGNGARMARHKHEPVQPLFTESNLAVPIPETKYGPTAPISPAASPRSSGYTLNTPTLDQYSPVSPRSSIASLPVEAAAAMEAREEHDDVELEIPWTLCTRKYYWKFVDNKLIDSNTDQKPPSLAHAERGTYTEIMASWVCKEAIKEAGYRVTQVQKDRQDGRRTRLETCFCIEQRLRFDQVKHLVERTVQLYRQTVAPTPPPDPKRSSFQPPPPKNTPKGNGLDRNRTPVPRSTHPPLERSTSSLPYSMVPPPLDRSRSMPGPAIVVPPLQQVGVNGFAPALPPQMAPAQYLPQPPLQPPVQPQAQSHTQRIPPYPLQTGPYSPQAATFNSPQFAYNPNTPMYQPNYLQPLVNTPVPQSPLRQSYLQPPLNGKYDSLSTSDSDSGERERSRRRRSKSRNRYSSSSRKKSSGTSKAMGALMGVGGLTALLDGLSGL